MPLSHLSGTLRLLQHAAPAVSVAWRAWVRHHSSYLLTAQGRSALQLAAPGYPLPLLFSSG